jgi:hypothetical protein
VIWDSCRVEVVFNLYKLELNSLDNFQYRPLTPYFIEVYSLGVITWTNGHDFPYMHLLHAFSAKNA